MQSSVKIQLLIATLLVVGLAVPSTAEGPLELEVNLKPKLTKYTLDQPIVVVAKIRNRAQHPTAFWKAFFWDPEGSVQYCIEDEDGHVVRPPLYIEYWGRERRTAELTVLMPGEEVTFSRAFTMNDLVRRAGSYRLRLAYYVSKARFEKDGELTDASVPIADTSVPIEGLTSFEVVEHE